MQSAGVTLALSVTLALPSAVLAEGGTVKGSVEVTPAQYREETVVYLENARSSHAPETVVMDQKGMRFIPHVLIVTVGDTVEFFNHDPVAHNVHTLDGERYDLGILKANQSGKYTFKKAGVYTQLCSLHPEMLAYVFVGRNHYAAVVDKAGNFAIKDVPPGTYELAVWNSHAKTPSRSITVTAGGTVTEDFSLKR
jgi:plastocyanin